MKPKNTPRTWVMATLAVASLAAFAQEKPKILTVPSSNSGALSFLSQNGQWACGDAQNPVNETFRAYPRLVNTATGKATYLWTEQEEKDGVPMGVNAVSNDGKTAGGNYYDLPAVWTESKGWQQLETSGKNYNNGLVSDITPDGKYGVGRCSINLWNEAPCMWDLETGKLIKLPGMVGYNPMNKIFLENEWKDWLREFEKNHPDWESDPDAKALYESSYQNYLEAVENLKYENANVNVRLNHITPDGKAVIGVVDYAYPQVTWEFVYYVDKSTWEPLGLKMDGDDIVALDHNIFSVQGARFSPDGSHIVGSCYSVMDEETPFVCPTYDTQNYTTYEADNMMTTALGNDGTVYASTPISSPLRDWSAYVGKYWYDWKPVLKQLYGIDWMTQITKDDTGYTGTFSGVSEDNLTLLATDYANKTSYLITLPKPMKEICSEYDLLADYSVNPMDGATFSQIKTVTLAFLRKVEVKGDKTSVQLLDEKGEPARNSINFTTQTGNPRYVDITFRPYDLEDGKEYTLVIPAGTIQLAGDAEVTNKEIRIKYTGRAKTPVKPISIYPEEGASLPRLNYTTNPIQVNFDAIIDAVQGQAGIRLYQDGEFLYNMSASINGSQMLVYPLTELHLADGSEYKVVFEAGIVADLSGAGENEEFTVTYKGSYVPEINPESNVIYRNEFEGTLYEMMLYEGDHNKPTADMAAYMFDADTTPWQFASDDETDFCAMSHSSYEPAGRSDDWMVTPQLYIPDDRATLTFQSQGFFSSKQDYLKVYVWEYDNVVTYLTESVINQIKREGDLVYNKLQDPGKNEQTLAGDWTDNVIDLAKYAGKHIYIAFLNDNEDQSIVFVDNLLVSREMVALLGIDNETTMFDANETTIKGRAVIEKSGGVDGYTLTLADGDGAILQTIESTAHADKGETINFSFPKPTALEKGRGNVYTVTFAADDREVTARIEIKNMAFRAKKRVVIEEFTGTGCPNCPFGIVAFEHLKNVYGDLVIPVGIHGYTPGTFITPEVSAYSEFLGLYAAPTGRVNRGAESGPMYSSEKGFSFTSPDGTSWLDNVAAEFNILADADVEINAASVEGGKAKVNLTVNFALDRDDANINLFGVVMEDEIMGVQSNNLCGWEDPILGEWGKGGMYGQSSAIYDFEDVVRGTSAVNTGTAYIGFNGEAGHIPSIVTAGEPLDIDFTFPMPSGVEEQANTKVCVMLIDANSGKVINAAVSGRGMNSVGSLEAEAGSACDGTVYDMTGRVIMRGATAEDLGGLQPGIYVLNGRKYAVK